MRVIIVGGAATGKTTLARALARRLSLAYTEVSAPECELIDDTEHRQMCFETKYYIDESNLPDNTVADNGYASARAYSVAYGVGPLLKYVDPVLHRDAVYIVTTADYETLRRRWQRRGAGRNASSYAALSKLVSMITIDMLDTAGATYIVVDTDAPIRGTVENVAAELERHVAEKQRANT